LASAAKSARAKAAQGMAELRSGLDTLGEQISRAKTQVLACVGISWMILPGFRGHPVKKSAVKDKRASKRGCVECFARLDLIGFQKIFLEPYVLTGF
jgi:hypothetical protein